MKTRNQIRRRAENALWMAGIGAFLALVFLLGMATAVALEAAAW